MELPLKEIEERPVSEECSETSEPSLLMGEIQNDPSTQIDIISKSCSLDESLETSPNNDFASQQILLPKQALSVEKTVGKNEFGNSLSNGRPAESVSSEDLPTSESGESYAPDNEVTSRTQLPFLAAAVPQAAEGQPLEEKKVKNSIDKVIPFDQKAEAYNNKVKLQIKSKPMSKKKEVYFKFCLRDFHTVSTSTGSFIYRCHICKGGYRQKFSLKRHFLRNHINPKYLHARDKSNCKIGKLNLKFLEQMSKTASGRNKINIDNAVFLDSNKSRQMPGLYKCHQCPEIKLDLESLLKEHYTTHLDGGEKFSCSVCNAVFNKKQALSKHMVIHTEIKTLFRCDKCPLQFDEVTEYTRHLHSAHSSGKMCKYCEKEFPSTANRKRHEALHEGGRGFSCRLCKSKFSRRNELIKHKKTMHTKLKLPCPHCIEKPDPVVFPSQHTLDIHIAEQHKNVTDEKSNLNGKMSSGYKTDNKRSSNESTCCYCKGRFPDVKAMMTHKSIAHKKKMALLKQRKINQKENMQIHADSVKGVAVVEEDQKLKRGPNKKKLLKKDVATETLEISSNQASEIFDKKRTTYERKAKQAAQEKPTKDKPRKKKDEEIEEKERLARIESNKFYAHLATSIADNLLNHVDGRSEQIRLKNYNFTYQNEPPDYRPSADGIPWSSYNFPLHFDVDSALSKSGEVKPKPSEHEQCLYATGLERNENGNALDLSKDTIPTSNPTPPDSSIIQSLAVRSHKDPPLTLDEKKKLLNYQLEFAIICRVCQETFQTFLGLEEHSLNNHPNVELSCLEVEGTLASKVPQDLRRPQCINPDGLFFTYTVPPTPSENAEMHCTKCKAAFNNLNNLHSHILDCGRIPDNRPFRKKFFQQKRIKNTMKHRMDLTVKQIKSNSRRSDRYNKVFKRGHTDKVLYKCGKDFFKIRSSKRGRRPASQPKPITTCRYCKCKYASESKLQDHYTVCPKRFKKKRRVQKFSNVRRTKMRGNVTHEPSPPSDSTSDNGNTSNGMTNVISVPDCGITNESNFMLNSDISKTSPPDSCATTCNSNLPVLALNGHQVLTQALPSNSTHSKIVVNTTASNMQKSAASMSKHHFITFDNTTLDTLRSLVKNAIPNLPSKSQSEPESPSQVNKSVEKANSAKIAENRSVAGVPDEDGYETKTPSRVSCVTVKTGEKANSVNRSATGLNAKESPHNANLPKIKEVIKEIQSRAASGLPNLKKSNSQLVFITPDEDIESTKPNTSGHVRSLEAELNSATAVSPTIIETSHLETRRKQRKRKPVKIIQKKLDSLESNRFPPLVRDCSDMQHSPLKANEPLSGGFMTVENSGFKSIGTEIPELVKEIVSCEVTYPNNTEKEAAIIDTLIKSASDDTSISEKHDKLSTPLFLPGDANMDINHSEDRDSPTLEILVDSVTKNIENFDKPSLLDDEKFALPPPDLPGRTSLENNSAVVDTSRNSLNFKVILPSVETPIKSLAPSDTELSTCAVAEAFSGSPLAEISGMPHLPTASTNLNSGNEARVPDVFLTASDQVKSVLSSSESGKDSTEPEDVFANTVISDISLPKMKSTETDTVNAVQKENNTMKTSTQNKTEMSIAVSHVTALEVSSLLEEDSSSKPKDAELLKSKDTRPLETPVKGKSSQSKISIEKIAKEDKLIRPECTSVSLHSNDTTQQGDSVSQKPKEPVIEQEIKSSSMDKTATKQSKDISKQLNSGDVLKKDTVDKNSESAQSSISVKNDEVTKNLAKKGKINSKLSLNRPTGEGDKSDLPMPSAESTSTEITKSCLPPVDKSPNGNFLPPDKNTNLRSLRVKTPGISQNSMLEPPERKNAISSSEGEENANSEPRKRKKVSPELGNEAEGSVVQKNEKLDPSNVTSPELICSNVKANEPGSSSIRSNSLPCAAIDEDKKCIIKKELNPEIVTHRNCPFCFIEFSYLSNFRRHIRSCPSKPENISDEVPVASTSCSLQFQHLPKKDEVENSMLSLFRHQRRQTVNGNSFESEKNFQKYTCPICHRIFLRHFTFMQHKMHEHLLSEPRANNPDDTSSCGESHDSSMKEKEDSSRPSISSASVNSLDPQNVHKDLAATSKVNSKEGANIELKNDEGSVSPSGEKTESIADNNLNNCNSLTGNTSRNSTQDDKETGLISSCPNVEKSTNKDGSHPVSNGKTADKSTPTKTQKILNPHDYKEILDSSFLVLPAYGKGRGRKKKSSEDQGKETESEEKLVSVNSSKATSSENKLDNNNLKISKNTSTVGVLKEKGKSIISSLKPSIENTLINKMRKNFSKSIQSGGVGMKSPLKLGKKTSNSRCTDTHEQKNETSFGSFVSELSVKKIKVEVSDDMDMSAVVKDNGKSVTVNKPSPQSIFLQQTGVSKRGRKKTTVIDLVPQSSNSLRGKKRKMTDGLSKIACRREIKKDNEESPPKLVSSPLSELPKPSKSKSRRNQSAPDLGTSNIPSAKRFAASRIIDGPISSASTTKVPRAAKTIPTASPSVESSPKSNSFNSKAKGKAVSGTACDNKPAPSTSFARKRGRNSKVVRHLVDSSEPEDVADFKDFRNIKKKVNKVCPICKKKFPSTLLRNRHVQLVHGRKNNRTESASTLVPVKEEEKVNKTIDPKPSRSSFQRQCSKPLPPMKRKYQKSLHKIAQPVKK